ncbi:hypothetical protein [Actinophytocola xanthii]|uniref:Uncharacterized protein n=1 Tax=Actinophytocola xanthii TaxID=1912961 RepID=A0A1Q8CX25_9PSEU|nr:hypothetical protein [Actinophytocola xanthii]OLF18911.1 hypothetical protein BU204_03360 [Actinophytocola xanthii]
MIRRVLALVLVLVLVQLAPPAVADTRRTPTECVAALDCSAEEIDLMSMAERLEFVRGMQAGPGASLRVHDRWRNIEGVITFFRDHGLGAPGSWVSYVDAGILEGIERGLAIALGRSADDFGNPGSRLWARYVTGVANGSYPTRSAHDRAWSEAEQASTEYGVELAESHGQYATAVEERFYQFSETYRWALRNRPVALDLLAVYGWLIHPDLARGRVPFYDWFTDVSESAPSVKGCEMAYGFAQLHPIAGVFGAAGLFLAYVTELFEEYQRP